MSSWIFTYQDLDEEPLVSYPSLDAVLLCEEADVFRHVPFGPLGEFMKELEGVEIPNLLGMNMSLDVGGDVVTRTNKRRLQFFDPVHVR
jgi:hypothetical protein